MRMEGIQGMLNQETAGWIVGMCALVLLIGLGGRYMRRLAAVALRAAAGTAGIYCLDLLFTACLLYTSSMFEPVAPEIIKYK